MDNEQLPVENLKGEPKPYTFRRIAPDEKDAEGNTVKRSLYKVFDRATGKPYEGFEDKEFESPLHGGRYFHSLFKEVDAKADADAKIAPVVVPPDSGNQPFNIPIIGEEPVIHVFGTKYYEMVIHEQDGDAKRKDIFVTDGCSRDFLVKFDVPVILPAGCLNVLRECVYTEMQSIDRGNGDVELSSRPVPRFSIQVNKEIPQAEAEAWLRDKKKVYLKRI